MTTATGVDRVRAALAENEQRARAADLAEREHRNRYYANRILRLATAPDDPGETGLIEFCHDFGITAEQFSADLALVRKAREFEAAHDSLDVLRAASVAAGLLLEEKRKLWRREEERLGREKDVAGNRLAGANMAAANLRDLAADRPEFFERTVCATEPPRLIRYST